MPMHMDTTEHKTVKEIIQDRWDSVKDKRFKSAPSYFPDGDHISIFFNEEMCFAESVDDLVTIYFSDETEKVVGFKIKGVSKLLRNIAIH